MNINVHVKVSVETYVITLLGVKTNNNAVIKPLAGKQTAQITNLLPDVATQEFPD
jgi:hypothetical protein